LLSRFANKYQQLFIISRETKVGFLVCFATGTGTGKGKREKGKGKNKYLIFNRETVM